MRAQRRFNRLCVAVAVAERRPLESRAIRVGFLDSAKWKNAQTCPAPARHGDRPSDCDPESGCNKTDAKQSSPPDGVELRRLQPVVATAATMPQRRCLVLAVACEVQA